MYVAMRMNMKTNLENRATRNSVTEVCPKYVFPNQKYEFLVIVHDILQEQK